MVCPSCQFANASGARRCGRCGLELHADPAVTFVPAARAVGAGMQGAGAAPALAVSDSDPHGAETIIAPRPSDPSSSDPDATIVTNSPFPGQRSPYPNSAAGTSMAPNPPGGTGVYPQQTSASWMPNFGPRYEVLSILGRGGMGAVFKARDLELDRIVALKLLRPELVPDTAAIQRFKQELLLASKVSHRNILRIHDLGDANGVKFISMAYIEGQDLHRLIQEQGRLPLPRALNFARQILEALDAAHREGVVHRDLKPQNIMVDSSDQLYVMDFGLAKSVEADTHMTMTGQVVGTPQYMAPEQVEGGPIDQRADLYAFGLILDEMVTGELVFKADSAFHLMLMRIREAPRSPRQIVPDLPDYIERIVMRCLMRSPAERYQSAREILNDIGTETAEAVPTQRTLVLSAAGMPAPAGSRKGKAAIAVFASLGASILIAAALLMVPGIRSRVSSAVGMKPPTRHIAVMPLKVANNAENFGYIADGIGDALTAELGDLSSVQVASATAIQKLPANVTPQQAADSLGADYVVGGTVTTGDNDSLKVVLSLYGRNGDTARVERSGVKRDLLAIENNLFNDLIALPELKLRAGSETARNIARSSGIAQAEDLYLQGRSLLSKQLDDKQVRAALDKFEQAAQADPNFALAFTGIADAASRLYKTTQDPTYATQARNASNQAEQLNQSLPEVYFSLGSVSTLTGEPATAVARLKHAVELAPNSDEGYRRLGDAYRAQNEKENAIAAYKKAIELNPYYWFNYNVLGTAYLFFGENQKAIEEFQQVLQHDPKNDAAYRNLGMAWFELGDFQKSVSALNESIRLNEKNPKGYSNLGTALFYLKRYDDAIPNFEKAVKLNPTDNNLGNLADAYRWSKRTTDAAATYQKAIDATDKILRVKSNDADALSREAAYYAKKGDSTRGLELARRAAQMDSAGSEVFYNLAIVQTIAGKDEEAVASLKAALKKGAPLLEAQNDPEFQRLQARADFAGLLSPGK